VKDGIIQRHSKSRLKAIRKAQNDIYWLRTMMYVVGGEKRKRRKLEGQVFIRKSSRTGT
jgi:hypothetical protein